MADVERIKSAAAGRWLEIIPALTDINPALLDGLHHACPLCGGTDRFRAFGDFEQTGGVICNQCHRSRNNDGVSTIRWLTGDTFPKVLARIADYLGISGSDRSGQSRTTTVNSQPGVTRKRFYLGAHIEKHDNQDVGVFDDLATAKPPLTAQAIKDLQNNKLPIYRFRFGRIV